MHRVVRVISLAVAVLVGVNARAHEGHRPLPTRGMEIDIDHGTVVLTKSARDALGVQTSEVGLQSEGRSIYAYGTIVPMWTRHAVIASTLNGRITALRVKPGDTVSAGDAIAELDSPELEQLQLELRTAQADLQLSTKLVDSTYQAAREGAVPGARLAEAQAKRSQNQAAIEVASTKWKALGLPDHMLMAILQDPQNIQKVTLPLVSPIQGVVTHVDLSLGKIVSPKEHLFEILDLSKVWLKIAVLEKDIASVKPGQTISLTLASKPDQIFEGVVDVVDSFLDPNSHQGVAWATLNNADARNPVLVPGMSGSLKVHLKPPVASASKLTVPNASIIQNGAERFVLVEQEQTELASTYKKQVLALADDGKDNIDVLSGDVFPGDRVVTRGSHELGSFFAQGVLKVTEEAARDIGLRLSPVTRGELLHTMNIDGVIDVPPTHRSVASSQLEGSIQSILVDRGQKVQQGDVLATVYSQAFQNLQLELIKTILELALQSSFAENLRNAKDAIAQRRVWETESLVNQLLGKRDTLMMQLRTAGLTEQQIESVQRDKRIIETIPVRAPIDGVVVGFDKFLGHVVNPDEPLFEIHDLSHAWVQGFISERDYSRVKIGQPVRMRFVANPTEIVTGYISRSGQAISVDDRTYTVWIELESMPSFPVQHSMLARIAIETGGVTEGVLVPRESIIREGMRSYVFVKGENEIFERRFVVTGISNDLTTQILDGLTEGESIAVQGALALQSGYAALK